ncbi:MAG: hypothetical protein M5R36_14090 [Deltaproteobacteria bacterium]|nr:hypothetical protein [Deltaproteobacteria bacterium]
MLNKISTGVALAAVLAAIAAGGCVRNASGERPEVIELESLRPPFPWTAAVRFHPAVLAAAPGATWTVEVDATADLRGYREQYGRFTELILAVQAHRRYDERGFYRSGPVSIALSSNFTTTGLPIERFDGWPTLTALHGKDGSPFEAVKAFPLDGRIATKHKLSAALTVSLPDDTPVGWYEPRIMIFARVEGVPDPVMLENYGDNSNTQDLQLLPLVRVGEPSAPHIPWTVLSEYYYRGQAGTLPDEDKNHVAVTSRSGFVSQLTLKPGSYTAHVALPSVFPLFSLAPIDGGQEVITERNLNYFAFDRGEVHGSIDGPTGRRDLGTRRMAGEGASGPLLEGGGFPVDLSATGDYTIRLAGYLEDRYGRRFEGGGTYRVTAAQPLSFSTSCKPGTSFLVGGAYPAKVNVNPPFPADVRVEVDYYPNSDPARKVTWVGAGKANRFGHFTPHAGPPLKFDEPGEYVSRTEARYVDARGELWLHRQTSGGVVAPRQPEVLRIHGTRSFPYEIRYERDDLGAEARFASRLDMTTPFLPFRPSPLPDPFAPHEKTDTLFIPSGGFNESIVEPHVSMSVNDPALRRRLVDGYRLRSAMPSPLLQPHGKSWEYLEDVVQVSADSAAWFAAKDALELPILPVGDGRWHPFSFPERNRVDAYAYLGVVRPGFPVMTSVLQSEAIGLYWSASPNRFGEQFNTGFNGDLPGDQYRIQAGAVVKDRVTGKKLLRRLRRGDRRGRTGRRRHVDSAAGRTTACDVGRPALLRLSRAGHARHP